MKEVFKRLRIDNTRQQGMVAIIFSIFIVIIISVVTIIFSYVMRREERQALDYQLTTQAQYAAETGINDVIQLYKSSSGLADFDDCDDSKAYLTNSDLSGPGTSYTCVLVDSNPETLIFNNVTKPKSFIIQNDGINALNIAWQNADYSSGAPAFRTQSDATNARFFRLADWAPNMTSTVEISIYPVRTENNFNSSDLLTDSMTFILYPSSGPVNTPISYAVKGAGAVANGSVLAANCNAANTNGYRLVNLTNLLATTNYVAYGVKVTSIYHPVSIFINGVDASGDIEKIERVQRSIEVTGRSNDVVRRIVVRVPYENGNSSTFSSAGSAVQALDGFCKKVRTFPGGGSYDNGECN